MAAGKSCTVRVQAQFDQVLASKRLATADEVKKVGFKPGEHIYVCDKANHEFVINVGTGEVAHLHSLNGYGPGAYALRDEWSQIKFVVDPMDKKVHATGDGSQVSHLL